MCGIVGYIGEKESLPILIEGLEALEYRGYDSAGVVFPHEGNKTKIFKEVGPVENLKKSLGEKNLLAGNLGVGHTRWATHGTPSKKNTHPHSDCLGRVFVVHNGIIENYKELKEYLENKGHKFLSDTDTEVVSHLIEDFLREGGNFKSSFFNTLKMIKGAYALAVVDSENKNNLYAARLSSPLVIGIGEKENFLASDPSALVSRTKKVIYLDDREVAEIGADKVNITNYDNQKSSPKIIQLEWNLEQAQKGNFPHFMLKEIFEGPEVIKTAFRGRLKNKNKKEILKLGGLDPVENKLKKLKRMLILACGTSYYAGMVGEYLFEELSKIPTEVHFASEFRYRSESF